MSHDNVLDPIGFSYYDCAIGDLLYVAINTYGTTAGRGLSETPSAVETVSYKDAADADLSGTLVGSWSIDGTNIVTPGIPIAAAGVTRMIYKVTLPGGSELNFRLRPSAVDPDVS